MVLTSQIQRLLLRLQELLPLSEDEVVQRGIIQAATDRIIELRARASALGAKYSSLEGLEKQVTKGVPADDNHTVYTDLLEWRAIRHEIQQLTEFLEAA
ncbi:MAG: hypothetical protein EHM81_09035 [Chloroflexi bacterium]|nr:MAG: hypothetical protein EHM81_09035 [Chloroflexota bacterium]